MADVRIVDLSSTSSVSGTDSALTVQSAVAKLAPYSQVATYVRGTIVGNYFFGSQVSGGLVTGKGPGYWTCPFAGTITAWNITVDAGTVTIKIWKIATGTAHPTTSNSINTSGIALSTGTSIHSTTLSDFTTTTVTKGDIFSWEITAVSGVADLGGSIEITHT